MFMIRNLKILLVLLGLLAPTAASAAVPCPYSPSNTWYWSVTDSSPSTQVWAGASGAFVALANGTYVAWVAAGCTATTIDTAANLNIVLNGIALSAMLGGSGSAPNVISSAVDVTLTNPMARVQRVTMSTGSKCLTLPQANLPTSTPLSFPFIILNEGSNSFCIKDSGGSTLISAVTASNGYSITLVSNSTTAGTYTKELSYTGTATTVSTCSAGQWYNALSPDFSGNACTQPAFSNLSGSATLAQFPTNATNTVLGNATSGTAVPTALAVGSCDTATKALQWTTNTGFGCNTSITAAAVPVGGITGLGTGVATALAVNVGSAGAFVTFNGALGSPSSAGTLPAYTLGGTISGGGQQINNVIIGTSTPLAGFFTTLSASSTTDASSTSTGAITTSGGLGVAKKIYAGSTMVLARTASIALPTSYAAADEARFTIFQDNSAFLRYLDIVSNGASGNGGGTIRFFTTSSSSDPTISMVLNAPSTASTSKTTGTAVITGGLGVSGAIITDTLNVITPATDAAHTDATLCWDTTSGLVLKGSGALGICLGTSGSQFKTAFAPMREGLAEIMQIDFMRYRYLPGFGDDGARYQYGTTAQAVERVLPDLVGHDPAGSAINYDSGALIFIGLRAIQELKADNDNLRGRLETLERRVAR